MKLTAIEIASNIEKLRSKMNYRKAKYRQLLDEKGDCYETNMALIKYEKSKARYAEATNVTYYSRMM